MLQGSVDELGQLCFGQGAYLGGFLVAIFEDDQGGNTANAEFGGGLRVGVNIDFANFDFASVFIGDFNEYRGNHLAGATPLGPEVDQHGQIRSQYFSFKTCISHVNDIVAHGLFSKINNEAVSRLLGMYNGRHHNIESTAIKIAETGTAFNVGLENNNSRYSVELNQAMVSPCCVAVDLGSNSFHLLKLRLKAGHWEVEQKLGRKVQLGLDMTAGELSPAAIERGLGCLRDFAPYIQDVDSAWLRVVATQAIRQASNRQAFIDPAEAIVQQSVEVISGEEEASLVYLGVHAQQAPTGSTLVIDVGGGSTEFAVGEGGSARQSASVPVGCVSLLPFFGGGQVSAANFAAARAAARKGFDSLPEGGLMDWQHCIGSSGTLLAVEQVLIQQGWSQQGIDGGGLRQLEQALLSFKDLSEVQFQGLVESRRSVFASGVAIVQALFDRFSIDHMSLSSAALREGVTQQLINRNFGVGQQSVQGR